MLNNINKTSEVIKKGGIIAYPTESVYGLGCDPFNEDATNKILQLKRRSIDKGLILIASSWGQLKQFTASVEEKIFAKALATWPGPTTWIFPKSELTPSWISGKHNSIAIRISNHPIVKQICDAYQGAIVSTSANVEGEKPAKTEAEVEKAFNNQVDLIVPGDVGDLAKPTIIRDLRSGQILRQCKQS